MTKGVSRVMATPAARWLAAQRNVNLRGIKGSGEYGSVIKADAQTLPSRQRITSVALNAANYYKIDLADMNEAIIRKDTVLRYVADKREPAAGSDATAELSAMRRTIAERMKRSMDVAPQYTMFAEYDVSRLMERYERARSDILASSRIKITFTDVLVKLAAYALGEHRLINASLLNGNVQYHQDSNIGIAVALDDGLIVPVILRAQAKTLEQIAQERMALVEKARTGRLAQKDMEGGTFTLSNLGMYPVDLMTPIINLPESAIMGVGRVVKKPVVIGDAIAIRPMMNISVTADHRLIDGGYLAKFMNTLNDCIEKPLKIF